MRADRVFRKLIDKIRLLSCKDRESYLILYTILGYVPKNIAIYKMAMTHSSTTLNGNKLPCNERLEFLGDAVLSSITADLLFSKFENEREGFLSKSRSNLVCRQQLNELAIEIGLDRFVTACGLPQQHNNYVYGNALEALIGAIYIDKGYGHCRRFMLDRVFSRLKDLDSVVRADKNYKSRLIEWSQRNHNTVEFKLVSEKLLKEGPFFVSDVYVNDVLCGSGSGYSKRESQQKAAKQAVVKLGVD